MNLFKAIGSIYRTSGLGRVSELGFETPTDSVKVEKMRGKSSDLREELYHKAGKVGTKKSCRDSPISSFGTFPSVGREASCRVVAARFVQRASEAFATT